MSTVEQQLRRIRSIAYRPPYRLTIAWDDKSTLTDWSSDPMIKGVNLAPRIASLS